MVIKADTSLLQAAETHRQAGEIYRQNMELCVSVLLNEIFDQDAYKKANEVLLEAEKAYEKAGEDYNLHLRRCCDA